MKHCGEFGSHGTGPRGGSHTNWGWMSKLSVVGSAGLALPRWNIVAVSVTFSPCRLNTWDYPLPNALNRYLREASHLRLTLHNILFPKSSPFHRDQRLLPHVSNRIKIVIDFSSMSIPPGLQESFSSLFSREYGFP
jgi:hypothetical protein